MENKGYIVVDRKPSIIWNCHDLIYDRIDADFFHIDYITNSAISETNKFFKPLWEFTYQPSESMNSDYPFENINYIDIGSVSALDGSYNYENFLTTEAPSRAKRIIKSGDVLVSTVRPNRNAVALVNEHAPENSICSTGFCVLRANDSGYLFAFFKTDYAIKELARRTTGGMYPAVSNEDVLEVKVPIPTDEVQQYIGDKIRKAEKLREEAKRLMEESESLLVEGLQLNQFMHEHTKHWIVSNDILEPYLNTNFYNANYLAFQQHVVKVGIPFVKMKELLQKILKNNSPDEHFRVERGIPSLIVSDIDPFEIDIDTPKIMVSRDYFEQRKNQAIKENDVVYTTAGPPLGEACLVVDEMLPMLSGAHVAVFRLNKKCTPGYLALVLNSLVGLHEVKKHSYGIRQQYLFNDQLSEFRIPLLPHHIQEVVHGKILNAIKLRMKSKVLVSQAKRNVEDLIEGKFDESPKECDPLLRSGGDKGWI